jgi:Spy/CpxP family protein refolding chaperone
MGELDMLRLEFSLATLLVAGVFMATSASSQPPGGKDGKDGKDGKGGPPRFELGQLIPPPLRGELKLTPEQEKQLDDLKNEVKGKLAKILTPEQVKAAENFRPRFGGPGGPGGPGGDKGGKGGPGGDKGPKGGPGGDKGGKGGPGGDKAGRPARPASE